MKLKYLSWSTNTEKDDIRGERGETTLWPNGPFLPPDQHSATWIGPPGPLISPVGKSKLKGDMQLSQCYRTLHKRLTQVLPHRDQWGHLWSSTTWDKRETQKGAVRPTVTGTQIMADHISIYSSTWAKLLATGSAHLQSQASGPIWLGSSVGSSAWFGSPAKGPY